MPSASASRSRESIIATSCADASIFPPFCFYQPAACCPARGDRSGRIPDCAQENGRTTISRSELLPAISGGASLSITYANTTEEMKVGSAAKIERPHWLPGIMGAFWRTYSKVILSAVFINMLAIASPIFTMNVYDRILPNKAISTLWVLSIGIGAVILFDLLLKTARASLIDYAGRKGSAHFILLSESVNSSMSASWLDR